MTPEVTSGSGDALYKKPAGILLEEDHWKFIQKRYHMTPRELQVAILVCRGFNNDEIAQALKIRHGTVKTHLRNIYRRTRVKSKILLLLRFVEDIRENFDTNVLHQKKIPISEIKPKSSFILGKIEQK